MAQPTIDQRNKRYKLLLKIDLPLFWLNQIISAIICETLVSMWWLGLLLCTNVLILTLLHEWIQAKKIFGDALLNKDKDKYQV